MYYAVQNSGKPYLTPKGAGGKSTGWFLPTCGQWYRIIVSPGIGGFADASVTYNSRFDSSNTALTKINNALTSAGGTTIPTGRIYWTSNDKESNGADAVAIGFYSNGILIGENVGDYKYYLLPVRSMLAF